MGVAGGCAGIALLERDGELSRIDRVISAVLRGHGGLLIIEGAAGMGKTALLQAVGEQAAAAGMQTLTARARELERDFGFGVVRQLLEIRLVRAGDAERAELLAGAAALAAPVLGLGSVVGGNDPFAAVHGLYWLVANLALGGPVVLAVDDLHWADEPSLRWMAYLCRRLEDLPILVAASTRPPRAYHPALLVELLAVDGAHILHPGPLSELAVGHLIRQGLEREPESAFVSACARLTKGNPFVLRELIFDLATDGVAPTAAQAAALALRVPARVERTILARLLQLDHTAIQLARAMAVLGEGSELRLAAALAELDNDIAAAAVDALLAADLLATARPVHFVHPLVRSAIYEQLPPGTRAQTHARAARLLIDDDAQPEQIAAQVLLCEPLGDRDAIRVLRAAAAAALHRGTPDTAIGYLRRALAEPPEESVRGEILGELGSAERITRNPAAVEHLEQAMHSTACPMLRARLANQLADVLFMAGADSARASDVLQDALDGLDDGESELAGGLHVQKATMELLRLRPTETPELALGRLRNLAAQGIRCSRSAQLSLAGLLAFRGDSCREIAALVEGGWDDGRFLAEETSEILPAILAIWALILVDDLEQGQTLAEAMAADAQTRGSVLGFASALGRQGIIALRRGTLAEAEADARTAFDLATEHRLMPPAPFYATSLGLALLECGQLDQAAEVLERVNVDTAMIPAGPVLLEARGRIHLARGDRAQAIDDLRRSGELAERAGLRNPNFIPWRSSLALALENLQQAREMAETELQLARRVGSQRAIGIALRVNGLVAGGNEGIALLEQSVTVLEQTAMRLELAHSLTELGAALRRAGARIAAREPLRRALDLAHRCGATPLTQRTRDEALAAGARPRRPSITGVHALTPSELRVARLATQSLSNRDIAQALFITTKTVNAHLASTYRKLNIHTRDQLATAMTTPTPTESHT